MGMYQNVDRTCQPSKLTLNEQKYLKNLLSNIYSIKLWFEISTKNPKSKFSAHKSVNLFFSFSTGPQFRKFAVILILLLKNIFRYCRYFENEKKFEQETNRKGEFRWNFKWLVEHIRILFYLEEVQINEVIK